MAMSEQTSQSTPNLLNSFTIIFMVLIFACSAGAGQFPVPDTGQTKCYDDAGDEINPCPQPGEPFYGQDANYSINPRSYTKLDANGNDIPVTATSWTMVKDNVTGLIWEVKTDDGSVHDKDNEYSWSDTEDFINELNSLNFGGFYDWRMPSVQELASIVNKNGGVKGKREFKVNMSHLFYFVNYFSCDV